MTETLMPEVLAEIGRGETVNLEKENKTLMPRAIFDWITKDEEDYPSMDKLSDVYQFIKDKREKKNEWICVDDALPEPFISVLVYMPGEKPCQTVHEGFISRIEKVWHAGYFDREPGEVTHWMPLPEPPKEVGNEDD